MTWFAVGAAAVAAVGTLYVSQQQAKAQDYAADVSEKNAIVARSQASASEDATRAHQRQVIGQQLAATSASGTGLTGTNLDLLNDSLYNANIDDMNIRYSGEVKARGQQDEAIADRFGASSTRTGGYISAAGKLVGGSASYLNSGGTVPSSGWDLSHTTRGSGD